MRSTHTWKNQCTSRRCFWRSTDTYKKLNLPTSFIVNTWANMLALVNKHIQQVQSVLCPWALLSARGQTCLQYVSNRPVVLVQLIQTYWNIRLIPFIHQSIPARLQYHCPGFSMATLFAIKMFGTKPINISPEEAFPPPRNNEQTIKGIRNQNGPKQAP